MVFYGPPDCLKTLQRETQRRVDGTAEDEIVKLVEEVSEGVLLELARVCVFPQAYKKKTSAILQNDLWMKIHC